jgi:hypothetical protein
LNTTISFEFRLFLVAKASLLLLGKLLNKRFVHAFQAYRFYTGKLWAKLMNSLYKIATGFSFNVMKPTMTYFPIALFLLLAFSCSTESPEPEGPEANESKVVPKAPDDVASDIASFPSVAPGGVPVVESNYTREPLSASSVVSIDQATWEKNIQFNEENRGFDSRTGNFLEGRVKVYGAEGQLSGVYNYKDGLAHGISEDYHSNGVVSLSLTYLHGKRHGKEEWFSDDGSPTYEANYKEDVRDGSEIFWNEEGAYTETIYSNGEVVAADPPVEEFLDDVGLDPDPVEEVPKDEKPDPNF